MCQNARNPPNLELVKFLFKLLPLFLVLVHACYALYEDQIGKFDWRQQYIGKVKFAYIDPSIAGTHKFHLATEENVLACLSTRTGSIIWRQVLEKGVDGIIETLSEEGEMITVSGRGRFIRSWDLSTGVLLWETSFPNIDFESDSVFKFFVNTIDKEIILVEMKQSSYTKVYVYSFTRATMKTSDVTNTPSVSGDHCRFLSSQFFLCLDEKKKFFHLLSIKDSGSFIAVPLKSFGIEVLKNSNSMKIVPIPYQQTTDKPIFALQIDNDLILFKIQPPGIKLKKIYPDGYAVTSTIIEGELIVFVTMPKDDGFNVVSVDAESDARLDYLGGKIKMLETHGQMENIFILPYVKRDQATSYKVLLSTDDHAIMLVHQQSRIIWSREEALANIVSVEILDLPLSETDANIEQEFGDAEASLLGLFLNRLKSQLYMLESIYHQSVVDLQHSSRFVGSEEVNLARDTFGLHKIIIAITRPGKVYGIDNLSGQIIWSHYEKELSPLTFNDQHYFPVFVQRTTAHFPFPPLCTVLGNHKNSSKSHLYSFDPITGETIESQMLPYTLKQTTFIGATDNQYLRGIILLDTNLGVHVYPETSRTVLVEHKNNHYIIVANSNEGSITGYSFRNSNQKSLVVKEAWKVNFPNKIIHVVLKRPLEHVHSQGRVMGDRSVLYKYLNPNLAAVFTEGNDPTSKTFCNVHLIDTITGLVVYSVSHKKCKQPIKVVHSENWIVYSYYNDKSRRLEVSTIELFEGMSQSNTTAFSSFTPPPLPLVEHQTFIFPSVIETMVDTVTERGMTNKHVLIGLPTGGILELPKAFLDPRRPINPTPEHREEGLIPYIPELPVMADKLINYNQSVMRIQGIQTAPSGLESTCLVFAYGLDLFYTRVTPSKTFDILKDDFDHYLISAVLLGLLLLSYTTKKLAARKSLKAAWK